MDTTLAPDERPERRLITLLAEPPTWAILQALACGDAHPADLQAQTGLALPVLTAALDRLRAAELITSRTSDADPQTQYYRLHIAQLHTLAQAGLSALHPALTLAPLAEEWTALPSPARLRVLFLCTHNSARSQIAEGLLRMLSGGTIDAASAGVAPASLHPLARETLAQVGAATESLYAKHIDTFAGQHFDYVITVCDQAREVCPKFPHAERQLHWSLSDPGATEPARQPKAFQTVAIELAQRIRYLLIFIERDRQQARTGAVA